MGTPIRYKSGVLGFGSDRHALITPTGKHGVFEVNVRHDWRDLNKPHLPVGVIRAFTCSDYLYAIVQNQA